MVRAVILDLDGTLVRVEVDWDGLRERVRRVLGVGEDACLKPLATAVLKQYRGHVGFRKAIELIENEELRSIESAEYPSGIPELIRGLRSCGYKVALVTLRSWRTAEPLLTRLGITEVLDVVITRDDVCDRASQLVKAIESLGVEKGEVVFVGDWEGDREAGEAVGIRTLIVKDPSDVVELLESMLCGCRKQAARKRV